MPVGTPALLASGRIEPRKVIGSIDTSEFLVALAASAGFLVGLGSAGVNLGWAVALLIGGVVAAPIAAWIVRVFPPRVLGSAVGGLILLTNTRTILNSDWVAVSGPTQPRYTRSSGWSGSAQSPGRSAPTWPTSVPRPS